jgi:hypothetical protein
MVSYCRTCSITQNTQYKHISNTILAEELHAALQDTKKQHYGSNEDATGNLAVGFLVAVTGL